MTNEEAIIEYRELFKAKKGDIFVTFERWLHAHDLTIAKDAVDLFIRFHEAWDAAEKEAFEEVMEKA
ncbi:MAG: hypothetical protein KAI17_03375 [Thiotrichaceae bacterium]|nr:hypothetical protein [Thiotrichaceae bacterium]